MHRAWLLVAGIAGSVAAVAIARWSWALLTGGPILYGEGAVAHAAQLARDRLEYATFTDPHGPIFVAANYPPLYFHVAGLGDPFVAGRIASIFATLAVAAAVFRTAYPRSGVVVGAALAATWLACVPIAVWGPAVKPDLVAIALTVGAVLAANEKSRPAIAGILIALAVWTKPTAALPALALGVYLRDWRLFARYVVGAAAASAGVLAFAWSDPRGMFEHIVSWNALTWHGDRALLLAFLLAVVFGGPVVLYLIGRPVGAPAAYAIAALGIVALGGREGASINYVLDLVAATVLGLAMTAGRLAPRALHPVVTAGQLVLALALVDPFGWGAGRAINTGVWVPSGRLAVVRAIPGDLLVEDAGLLVADGRPPRVDDLFLWSRLMDRGSFPEGERLLAAVRAGEFDGVVSEVDLSNIATAPAYERERWHPRLVDAVLARYRLARQAGGMYIYERAVSP
jgi:hypothetical protein